MKRIREPKIDFIFKWRSSSSRSKVYSTKSVAAVFTMPIFGFLRLSQTFVGVTGITRLEDFLTVLAAINIFSRLPALSQSCRKARALF